MEVHGIQSHKASNQRVADFFFCSLVSTHCKRHGLESMLVPERSCPIQLKLSTTYHSSHINLPGIATPNLFAETTSSRPGQQSIGSCKKSQRRADVPSWLASHFHCIDDLHECLHRVRGGFGKRRLTRNESLSTVHAEDNQIKIP